MISGPCVSGQVLMQRNLCVTLLCVRAQHPYLSLLAPETCPLPRPQTHLSISEGVSWSRTRHSLRGSTSPPWWYKIVVHLKSKDVLDQQTRVLPVARLRGSTRTGHPGAAC